MQDLNMRGGRSLFIATSWVVMSLFLTVLLPQQVSGSNLPNFYIAPGTGPSGLRNLQTAFKDALLLARVVAVMHDDCEPCFLRYFQKQHSKFVRDVFRTIANIDLDAVITPENMLQYLPPNVAAINPRFRKLTISLNDPPPWLVQLQGLSCSLGKEGQIPPSAHIIKTKTGHAFISLCEWIFDERPTLTEIQFAPAKGRDAEGQPLPGFECDGLGDRDTDWMISPGGILLHELMHWTAFFSPNIPAWNNLIRGVNGYHSITDYESQSNSIPEDGYGPFHAEQLLHYSTSLDPSKFRQNEVLQNADSYHCYANSKYWSWVCNKGFNPALGQADSRRRGGVVT